MGSPIPALVRCLKYTEMTSAAHRLHYFFESARRRPFTHYNWPLPVSKQGLTWKVCHHSAGAFSLLYCYCCNLLLQMKRCLLVLDFVIINFPEILSSVIYISFPSCFFFDSFDAGWLIVWKIMYSWWLFSRTHLFLRQTFTVCAAQKIQFTK